MAACVPSFLVRTHGLMCPPFVLAGSTSRPTDSLARVELRPPKPRPNGTTVFARIRMFRVPASGAGFGLFKFRRLAVGKRVLPRHFTLNSHASPARVPFRTAPRQLVSTVCPWDLPSAALTRCIVEPRRAKGEKGSLAGHQKTPRTPELLRCGPAQLGSARNYRFCTRKRL